MPPRRTIEPRTPSHVALGQVLRQARADAGLSQEGLALRINTDLSQIGGIERGTRNPSYLTLLRLADALNTSVGALTTRADQLRDQFE
jgi:transcriptional regulator with XRE-family HTH domain